MTDYPDIGRLLATLKPDVPVYALRPHLARQAAEAFVGEFPGDALYAVKANPHPAILKALYAGGIRHFDVASLHEIRLIRELFPAMPLYFMHPVKSETAIAEAAHKFNVTHFVVDHADELEKIIRLTKPLKLTIIIRLAVPKGMAVYDLGGKFGCSVADAVALSQTAQFYGHNVGYSFHVGSQCLQPPAYRQAIDLIGDVVRATHIAPVLVDVGGGFPVPYRYTAIPPFSNYIDTIRDGLSQIGISPATRLLAEPGRALAATSASLLVKVELRRGNQLYLNDGMYGGISELRFAGLDVPMRVWRMAAKPTIVNTPIDDFRFCGPTCDSADILNGPFPLPADTRAGDYIEMDMMGAYSLSLRSNFNGFAEALYVNVNDHFS